MTPPISYENVYLDGVGPGAAGAHGLLAGGRSSRLLLWEPH